MRFIETGIQDKDAAYFFDNSRFDIYSYFIYFDSSDTYMDCAGYVDETSVTFEYPEQDYSSDFMNNIYSLVSSMRSYLFGFQTVSNQSLDSARSIINHNLHTLILQYIDKINYYNQIVTKNYYYDHSIHNIYPFSEFIIVKLHDSTIIANVMLNKFIKKEIDSTTLIYKLSNEILMGKYLYHYSTNESDYTSLYFKSIYNYKDYETVNKEYTVLSQALFPRILNDSSHLYMDVTIDSTTSDLSHQYELFGLAIDDLVYLNNKYIVKIKNIIDSTQFISSKYTISKRYIMEFLEFDTTYDLSSYMNGDYVYYDFTKISYNYKFNIRTIKKISSGNIILDGSEPWLKTLLSIKTFFGYENRSSDSTVSDQRSLFTSLLTLPSIMYSGVYDTTNNTPFNLLPLISAFSTNKYSAPYDSTILKSAISDNTYFVIDLYISSLTDVTLFAGNYIRNGLYIFNEANTLDAMILRINDSTQLDSNTFRLNLTSILVDSEQLSSIGSVYHIPSSSYLTQYKYHIYNVIPYLKLDKFEYENDINNLLLMHLFGYILENPLSIEQNGYNINI